MPVNPLPDHPNIDHLKYQAKDLLRAHAMRDPAAAQRSREFHPQLGKATDAEIFNTKLTLSDAQLIVARERGFASWPALKRRVEKPRPADDLNLPHHERITDKTFRHAVELLDAGDADDLRSWLKQHPDLVRRHVTFEGGNYFRNPTLLEFVAENPVRHGTLPANIAEVANVILDAGAKEDLNAVNETLGLVCSGSVARECGVQVPLIDLLCQSGADPDSAMAPALPHGEFEAVDALLRHGAHVDLFVAAGLGRSEDCRRLLATASADERHRALAMACQFGHAESAELLLDAGEDPNRYNPLGTHAHSTPLHQAAGAGHEEVVRLLVKRGARLDIRDTLWHATPADWARHEGRSEVEKFLRDHERHGKKE